MKLPMRLASAFCLFIIFGNLQSQKLIGFEVSKCLTDCKFEKSTIENLEISKGQTEILLRTLANCNGNFIGKAEILNDGILNLMFEIKPTEGTDKKGKKFSIVEAADCDCPFDFSYKIDGLELQDTSLIRINGLKLSELQGPLVEEIQIDIGSGIEEKEEDEDQIFPIVEEQAAPVGGMSAFYKFVGEEMRYPAQARKMQVEGRVFCEFTVNSDGSIQDVRVIRGIGAGCDDEAIRIINASAPWKPGKQKGKPVRSKYNVAIVFRLSS